MPERGTKEFSNNEITVVWKPDMCIHSGNCVENLPGVFKSKEKPWIVMDGGSTQEIKETIAKCPSGALSYRVNDPNSQQEDREIAAKVTVMADGPYIVEGDFELKDADGRTIKTTAKKAALCRCGESGKKPFCDGTHKRIEFIG